MPAPKAPVLGGKSAKDVSLTEEVFAVELKPHLVHEAVRAELNSHRQGTGAAVILWQALGHRGRGPTRGRHGPAEAVSQ